MRGPALCVVSYPNTRNFLIILDRLPHRIPARRVHSKSLSYPTPLLTLGILGGSEVVTVGVGGYFKSEVERLDNRKLNAKPTLYFSQV